MNIPWHRYSLVLFDFDDTLVDFQLSESIALAAVCKSLGLKFSQELLIAFKIINHRLWSQYDHGHVSRDYVFAERFKQLLQMLAFSYDPLAVNQMYLGALALTASPFPSAKNLLASVKRNAIVGIITNGHGPTQRSRLKISGFDQMIDFCIISDEVGYGKPDPRIFHAAFESSGIATSDRVLMVGDNYKADILGAKAMGYDTCWVGQAAIEGFSDIEITYRVRCVNELNQPYAQESVNRDAAASANA